MDKLKRKHVIFFISFIILVAGYLLLWFSYPLFLNKLGGFNLLSFGLNLFFISFIVLLYFYLFTYAQGKPMQRWKVNIGLTYAMLVVAVALAFTYDSLLPENVPTAWRYFILPLATIVVVFHVLRRIPKIREKLDKLSE